MLWDEFVTKAKNSTFLFYRDFMEYHQDKFDDYSLLIFKEDKLVALLPSNLEGAKLISHQGLSYGGLILNENIKFLDVLESFKLVLQFLYDQDRLVYHEDPLRTPFAGF